jgi:hypothetical protein
MKSGKLKFLELSGPLQACNGTALPFTPSLYLYYLQEDVSEDIVTPFKDHEKGGRKYSQLQQTTNNYKTFEINTFVSQSLSSSVSSCEFAQYYMLLPGIGTVPHRTTCTEPTISQFYTAPSPPPPYQVYLREVHYHFTYDSSSIRPTIHINLLHS